MNTLEKIHKKAYNKVFSSGNFKGYYLTYKKVHKEVINNILKELEESRITDNSDYISIPIEKWNEFKGLKI